MIKEFPVVFCENPRPGNKYEKPLDTKLKDNIATCKQECILYLMEYLRRLKTMKSLRPTARVNTMVEKHKKKSNPVLQFIDEKTEEHLGTNIHLVDIYARYRKFMTSENPGEVVDNKNKVIEEIKRMRHVQYIKVRANGKGPQPGLKNRRFIEEEEENVLEGDD